MKATLLLLVSFALLSAEKCRDNNSGGDASNLVELRTSGCFGFCPVFKLTVFNNGLTRYNGEMFVEKTGQDSFRLSPAELKKLKEKVEEVNLWQYPDRLKTDVADAPSATLTVFKKGESKSVTGSIDRPAPLLELEALLKDLAEAHGLQVKRGVNPRDIPEANRRELIVKFKPEVKVGNWVMQIKDVNLQLVRRVTSDNIWLVAYDFKQVDEKTLIALLKKTEGVVEAQPNSQVEDRN